MSGNCAETARKGYVESARERRGNCAERVYGKGMWKAYEETARKGYVESARKRRGKHLRKLRGSCAENARKLRGNCAGNARPETAWGARGNSAEPVRKLPP